MKMNRGFTLIELLVVIAIIGTLSSIVLASMNNARKKARDARRAADANSIWTALQLYIDEKGCAPITSVTTTCDATYSEGDMTVGDLSNIGGFMTFLQTTGYMTSIPADPTNNSTMHYLYFCYQNSPIHLTAHPAGPGPILQYTKEDGTTVELFEKDVPCR